jgi:Zn-dependent protease/CBS domain-containing protein
MGIEVRVHITFLLLLAFFGMVYYAQGGAAGAIEGVGFVLALFGCVVLHEFGHAIAARNYGIKTPDITLLPIGGVARLEKMPDKPVEEMIVAIAGPLVNVAIIAGLAIFSGGSDLSSAALLDEHRSNFVSNLLWANVMIAGFNLLPAFPMDGGRILRALLATRMSYGRATQIAASVGQGMAFVFGFLGLVKFPLLIVIAVFIYIGASQEAAYAQMRDVASGMPVSEAMVTDFQVLPESSTLQDAIDVLIRTSQHDFPVVTETGEVAGVLTRQDLLKSLKQGGTSVPVRDVMRRGIPSVSSGSMFEEAFRVMNACGCPALPVLNRAGQLVGLITPENVGELMMIHAALGGRRPAWKSVPPPMPDPGAPAA